MKKFLAIASVGLLFSGCATVVTNTSPVTQVKRQVCVIVPFDNYSETPLAGKRVAAIAYGVLRSKGYKVILLENEVPKSELQRFDCVIRGSVNEWRYKVGIDGEPAVSVTYMVENPKTGRTYASGTLSATEWGNKSLGILTQELFRKAF